MKTKAELQKRPQQPVSAVNKKQQNQPDTIKKEIKPNVRTTDYKKMENIILTDPDSLTREEFLFFQSAVGYRRAIQLLNEGKRRKQLRKMDGTGKTVNSLLTNKEQEKTNPKQQKVIQKQKLSQVSQKSENELIQKKASGKNISSGTSLPNNLRSRLENLSGIDLFDVSVHKNSEKPQQVGALAYTQGNNIHIAPGQEKHLPHEGWHAVQQKQGRVAPTLQMKSGTHVNDDAGLEKEADVMGDKAEKFISDNSSILQSKKGSIIKIGKLKENINTNTLQKKSDSKEDKNISFGKYKIGEPQQPEWKEGTQYDEDFKYDPKAKATDEDRNNWLVWGAKSLGAGILSSLPIKIRNLPDAVKAYDHYRSAKGTDLTINYKKAFIDDKNIRNAVCMYLSEAQIAAEELYKISKKSTFKMTGKLLPIGGDNYPVTENWQKTIGAHFIWISAKVTINKNKITAKFTVHEIDRYNFNKGMSDIATGTKDDINGRFAVLGWAKSFNTVGKVEGDNFTWNIGEIENSSPIKKSGGR